MCHTSVGGGCLVVGWEDIALGADENVTSLLGSLLRIWVGARHVVLALIVPVQVQWDGARLVVVVHVALNADLVVSTAVLQGLKGVGVANSDVVLTPVVPEGLEWDASTLVLPAYPAILTDVHVAGIESSLLGVVFAGAEIVFAVAAPVEFQGHFLYRANAITPHNN